MHPARPRLPRHLRAAGDRVARLIRRLARALAAAGLLLALALAAVALWRSGPADPPWAPLDLGEPAGPFTGRKLAALGGRGLACRRLLARAGVRFAALPPRRDGARCGYDDAVRLGRGGALPLAFRPGSPGVACPVAAGLALWHWDVVQPAARRLLGARVVAVEHLGSYNCRRIAGRGGWSEHARADALDVAGFRLGDGRRISVARDWRSRGPDGRFLRAVRDGACGLFSTVLSPDHNAAHRDHLHLDQAGRGALGWRACR